MKVNVKTDNGNLITNSPLSGETILYPETDKEFYEIGRYALVHFKLDGNGNVLGFQLEQYANKLEFDKVQ